MEENKKPVEPSVDLQQLVADADTGGREVGGVVGKIILFVAVGWSRLPALVRLAAALRPRHGACSTTPRRARSTWASRSSWGSSAIRRSRARGARACPGTTGSSRSPAPSPAPISCCSTTSSPRGRASPTCRTSWWPARASSCCSRPRAARSALPMTVLAILFLVYIMFGRYMPDVLAHKGASLRTHALAPVAHDRGRLRRGAGRVVVLHLHLRALRRAARPRRRRQLHDAGVDGAARPPARRARQGRGRVLGPERPHLRLVGLQRGLRRHLHHPAHEEGGLRRREGRRHRDHELGERPDHAAGDGRGRVPDGRVRGASPTRRSASTRSCRPRFPTSRSSTSCTWRR